MRVRKLYRCQLIIVRQSLDDPLTEARYFASSDLKADRALLLAYLAARGEVETLFADTKEELGLDHDQLMSATGIVHFWTLVMAAYLFLDEERVCLRAERQPHITLGEARREVQRCHRWHPIDWLADHLQASASRDMLYYLLNATGRW